jgi:hypothetical protein
MHLLKFILSVFLHPEIKFKKELIPQLKRLNSFLSKLQLRLEPLNALVAFYQEMAHWYDQDDELRKLVKTFKSINTGNHDQTIQDLSSFIFLVESIGKYPSTLNKTKKGEKVTADKICLNGHGRYLDGHSRFSAQPVSFWLKTENKIKKDSQNSYTTTHREYEEAVENAAQYLDVSIKELIKIIKKIETDKR